MGPNRVTPPRGLRALRGVLLGASSSALAVAAHAMAGGGLPDTTVTLVLSALVGWAGNSVAERRHGLLATTALLGVSQFALHLLLTDVAVHPGAPPVATDPVLMTAAHAVATVLTAVLLTRASAALAAVSAALSGIVAVLVHSPLPEVAPARPVPVGDHDDTALAVLLRLVCARRGPPAVS